MVEINGMLLLPEQRHGQLLQLLGQVLQVWHAHVRPQLLDGNAC
jgi:hypothetical protein